MKIVIAIAWLLSCATIAYSAEPEPVRDNWRLAELFEEDQDDRRGFPNTKRSYVEINKRDEERRSEVVAMMRRLKEAWDPHDILNPGKVFQTT